MKLKNRVWMTGNLEWFAYIGEEQVFLGRREVPYPFTEGDAWISPEGNSFRIKNEEIVLVEKVDPPDFKW
ncbi:MAG: hypothetical protein FWD70_02515 [Desulfuromonadales bacterium]|nr:hypothetical protein [Desulfuromonadales bacterium]